MKTYTPLFLFAALGLLSISGTAAAAADTSNWKCTSCPYPKSMTGNVEAGLGTVSEDSKKFGDFTGLDEKGAHLVLGGALRVRGAGGYYADLQAANLGLDTRSLLARGGHEGLYGLQIGYTELPRHFFGDAFTPFSGVGGDTLTLPPGFRAANTSAMPLATTLQPVDVGYKRTRLDLGGSWIALQDWTVRVGFRRDVRDGTRALYGAFYIGASQLVAPVDEVTDQLEVSAAYATRRLQLSLGYLVSRFDGGPQALTWDSPFLPVVPGADRGQLALAPGNQLHQLTGSAGWTISPIARASADFAFGRLTQNDSYLSPTLNASLAARVPPLPASSLDGRVLSFNGNAKLSVTPVPELRLLAVYARDVRDNQTDRLSYPLVSNDSFLDSATRTNTPFSLTQDRLKLGADYRGFAAVKLSVGAEQDNRLRNFHEALTTRETTVWASAGLQPTEDLALALKLTTARREHTRYGTAIWFGTTENPLLRKYNLARRERDTAGARADYTVNDKISVGLSVDYANDAYDESIVGLRGARSVNAGLDLSAALGEQTQLTVYAQSERIRSDQGGSASGPVADWSALNKDRFDMLGLGIKHTLLAGKLEVGANVSASRSRSDVSVDTGRPEPLFPSAETSLDSVRVHASYKLQDNLWLSGSLWHERYTSQDWRLDGVLPATVLNLLSLGAQSPQYDVNVLQLALRYRF
jgi:MtrB/PioB family decaheme-associated outer membrane protein